VANEVETEQILTVAGTLLVPPRSSSLILHRGSIPLFWSHTNIFAPNPDIQLEPMDKDLSPCDKHFQRLFRSYGPTVVALSLIKQSQAQREVLLGNAYRESCAFLNTIYKTYDPISSQEYSPNNPLENLFQNSSSNNMASKEYSRNIPPDENSDNFLFKECSMNIPCHILYSEYDMLHDNTHESQDTGNSMIAKLQQMAQDHIILTGFFTQGLCASTLHESFRTSRFLNIMDKYHDMMDLQSDGEDVVSNDAKSGSERCTDLEDETRFDSVLKNWRFKSSFNSKVGNLELKGILFFTCICSYVLGYFTCIRFSSILVTFLYLVPAKSRCSFIQLSLISNFISYIHLYVRN
jgi:SacI homology domain